MIGWRGTFFITVPIGIAALVWQLVVLPRMPATSIVSVARILGLLRNRTFAIGMAATALAFIGQNALSIYLRPFLEGVTGLQLNVLSMVLLGLGVGGLAGTSVIGLVARRHLLLVLAGLPAALAVIALLLIALGPFAAVTASLLVMWGFSQPRFRSPGTPGWPLSFPVNWKRQVDCRWR